MPQTNTSYYIHIVLQTNTSSKSIMQTCAMFEPSHHAADKTKKTHLRVSHQKTHLSSHHAATNTSYYRQTHLRVIHQPSIMHHAAFIMLPSSCCMLYLSHVASCRQTDKHIYAADKHVFELSYCEIILQTNEQTNTLLTPYLRSYPLFRDLCLVPPL